MPSLKRSYRILGLPPGSPKEDVKRAYLDLVQVWHPDRFAHNPRLQKKAEDNVKRINEAYEALKNLEPEAETVPRNWLSDSYAAIVDLGDLLKTGAVNRPAAKPTQSRGEQPRSRQGPRVVGLDPVERTREVRVRHRSRRSPRGLVFGAMAAVAVAVIAWLLVSMIA
jgi:hypothetical protein